jgi:hypothetical protein
VDSLKVLDPEWPIREADVYARGIFGRSFAPQTTYTDAQAIFCRRRHQPRE